MNSRQRISLPALVQVARSACGKKTLATSKGVILKNGRNELLLWRDPSECPIRQTCACGSTALVTTLSLAFMSFSASLFAQDANSGASSPPTNLSSSAASQEPQSPAEVESAPLPSTRWNDPATVRAKNWGPGGSLSLGLEDPLLGDVGGVRSALADYGIAATIVAGGTQFQNLLDSPTKTNGSQAYIGQKYTAASTEGVFATYDLGHIGLQGAQIIAYGGCSVSSDLSLSGRGCRAFTLSFYDSFFRGRVELSAGILPNDVEFVDTYVGGNLTTGAFGPSAILPVQSGLSQQPGAAPALNLTYHFDANWYEKIGVQRSESPQGLVQDYSYFNRHGITFSEPDVKELVIDEAGFRQTASADTYSTYIRAGGLYNWTQYTDFSTGGTAANWNAYLLADQQLTRPEPARAYRGWYGGFTVMESPSNVNVFRSYYEVRLYDIGPFESRPEDQFNIVGTHALFSGDARQFYIEQGVYPPQKDTSSVTMSYACAVTHSMFIISGLAFTNNPSFLTEPGEGHDLNFFISFFTYL
jgi:porin